MTSFGDTRVNELKAFFMKFYDALANQSALLALGTPDRKIL